MRGGTLKDIMKNEGGKHRRRLLEFIISESGKNLTIKLTEIKVDWNYSYILWDKLLRYNKCPHNYTPRKYPFKKGLANAAKSQFSHLCNLPYRIYE